MVMTSPAPAPIPIPVPSLSPSEEPDSRTSSVGRKRGFSLLSVAEGTIITIEEDSSDEHDQPHEKRVRYNEGSGVDDYQLKSTTDSSPNVVIISDSSESAHSPEDDRSTSSSDDFLTDGSGNFDAGCALNLPPAWNLGVSVTIRTSLTDCKPEAQPLSTQEGVVHKASTSQEVSTAATAMGATRIGPTKQSLDGDELGTFEPKKIYSEEAVDAGSKLEREVEVQRLEVLERKLKNTVKGKAKTKPKWSIKLFKRSGKKAELLAQLSSSFGPQSKQKEAEQIIKGLPEMSKKLMPRDVADTTFNFVEIGRTFKLPRKLPDPLPIVPLAKLNFRDPHHNFVAAFLEENLSMLEFVDYELLVRAFREYVRLLYGHLPDGLISMVCSSKHAVGPKAEKACSRYLEEARKIALRKAEFERIEQTEARTTGREVAEAELRVLQAQLAEARKAAKSTRKRELKAAKKVEAAALSAKRKGGRAANEAQEPETRNTSTKPQKYPVFEQQAEAGALESNSLRDLPLNLDGQTYEMAEKSQDLTTYSMGRLLGSKRAQSFAAAPNTHGTMKESSDKLRLVHNQEPNSETMLDDVHISDQAYAKQKPDSMQKNNLELVRRYYPSSDGVAIVHYCLTCAQTNHDTSNCPSLICTSCGLCGVHFTAACPKKQRCTKCHKRGHQKFDCLEKLAATADKSLRCDICSSNKHLESACHFLWRSFKPGMLKTTKVVGDIPIHCYACGAAGHFGSECGIRRSPLYAEGHSWSMINWKRYVDSQSHNRAISAVKDFSLPLSTKGKKGFSIKGTAQQNGHISHMDDDSNIPFIREKVNKPARLVPRGNQQIKFDQNRPENVDYLSRPHFGPPLPDSRNQPRRAVRPTLQQISYAEDRHDFSYRPRDDSARDMRERTFSSSPRFDEERYPLRPGDNYYRIDEAVDSYRPHDRGGGGGRPIISTRAADGRSNYHQGPTRAGLAQGGRGSAGASRDNGQCNRKG